MWRALEHRTAGAGFALLVGFVLSQPAPLASSAFATATYGQADETISADQDDSPARDGHDPGAPTPELSPEGGDDNPGPYTGLIGLVPTNDRVGLFDEPSPPRTAAPRRSGVPSRMRVTRAGRGPPRV